MNNWKSLFKKSKKFLKLFFFVGFCSFSGKSQEFTIHLTSDSVNLTCNPYKIQVKLGDDFIFVKRLSRNIWWKRICLYPLSHSSTSHKIKRRFFKYIKSICKKLKKEKFIDDPPAFDLTYVHTLDTSFFVLQVHRIDEPEDSSFYQFLIPLRSQKWIVSTWGLFHDFKANLNYNPDKIKFMGYIHGNGPLLEFYCDYQITYPFRYRVIYYVPVHENYFFYDPETASGQLSGKKNLALRKDLSNIVVLILKRKIHYYSFATLKKMNRKEFYQMMGRKEEWQERWATLLGMEILYEVTDDGKRVDYQPIRIAPVFFNQSVAEKFPTIVAGEQFSINEPVKETPGFVLYSRVKSFCSDDFQKRIQEIPYTKDYVKVLVKMNDAFPITIEQSYKIQELLHERRYNDLPSHYSQ